MPPVTIRVLETIRSRDAVWTVDAAAMDAVRARFPQVRFDSPADREGVDALLPEADVVLGPGVRERNFARARRLRWIHTPSAGVDHLLFPALVESEVTLTNSRGVHDDTMAEHTIAVMLAFARKLHLARDAQHARRWSQQPLWRESPAFEFLAGSTIAIVGFGSIGRAIAARARALGQTVLAVRRHAGGEPGPAHEVHGPAALDDVLGRADWVVLVLPQTSETRGLLSRERLARLRPGARLVNLGRGSLVDEDALIEALRDGRLAGAALDVTATEPLPPESPLWEMPQVILTPHVSGLGPRYWHRALQPFADNLARFLAGEPLQFVVDKRAGY
jgi:phosphoglycerate dehydrogenase-like enzyme